MCLDVGPRHYHHYRLNKKTRESDGYSFYSTLFTVTVHKKNKGSMQKILEHADIALH